MKIRTNFVSNSSSSSFLLSYNLKNTIAKIKGFEFSVGDFLTYVNSLRQYYGDSTEIKALGKDNVIDYINEYWCDSETKNNIIEKIVNTSNKENIMYIQINYRDDIAKKLLSFLINNKKMFLLVGELD